MTAIVTSEHARAHRSRARLTIVAASLAMAVAGAVTVALVGTGDHKPSTTTGLTATLHVSEHPSFPAVAGGSLWVAAFATPSSIHRVTAGTLLQLNLGTGAVQHTVQLAGAASYIISDGDRVLADDSVAGSYTNTLNAPGELLAVDAHAGRVLARISETVTDGPLAVGGGHLWAVHVKPGLLQERDPITLKAQGPAVHLSSGSVYAVAYGDGYVWASAGDDGDVLRIDPSTLTIQRTHVGGFPVGIAVVGGSVWVIDTADDTLLRLDPKTLRMIGPPLSTPAGGAFYLATTDGYVFVANHVDGTITRVDSRTGRIVGAPIRVAPRGEPNHMPAAYAIAADGDAIWATSESTNTVSRIQAKP